MGGRNMCDDALRRDCARGFAPAETRGRRCLASSGGAEREQLAAELAGEEFAVAAMETRTVESDRDRTAAARRNLREMRQEAALPPQHCGRPSDFAVGLVCEGRRGEAAT